MSKSAWMCIGLVLALATADAGAQTVTGTGTTNTVPVFTGTATVGNSPISVSGGNVGIGAPGPNYALDIQRMGYAEMRLLGNSNGAQADTRYQALNVDGSTNYILTGVGINANNQYLILDQLRNNDIYQYLSPATGTNEAHAWYIGGNEKMRINYLGNVGIGTASPGSTLEVKGSITLTAGSGASMKYQDGTVQSTAWNGVLPGGDYAESVDVSGDRAAYEPGDVLVIDPASKGKFTKSSEPYSTAVMGVYSTRPGVVGRRQKSDRSHMKDEVPLAMVGVVPTKATAESGAIKAGDLLVTSSRPGYAMKGTDRSLLTGAIIGKALEPLNAGTGVIEVAISIQ